MTPASPQVSIIIPTYNRSDFVVEAVDSALRQQSSELSLEVIVIDDGSTDNTFHRLLSFGDSIRLLRQENMRQCAARNRGLQVSTGTYIKFHDSDDLLVDGSLVEEVRTARSTAADLVVADWIELDTTTAERSTRCAPEFSEIVDDLLVGRSVPTSAALYRRRVLATVRWDTTLKTLDDWDFFCMAALKAASIATVHVPAYIMRHHDGPRASDASMFTLAIAHHQILRKLESCLEREGQLTTDRKRRLAQYYYKELRVMQLTHPETFHRAADHILALDPTFTPVDEERSGVMRMLARGIGFRKAIQLHGWVKKKCNKLLRRNARAWMAPIVASATGSALGTGC